jgi:hypothetical protein
MPVLKFRNKILWIIGLFRLLPLVVVSFVEYELVLFGGIIVAQLTWDNFAKLTKLNALTFEKWKDIDCGLDRLFSEHLNGSNNYYFPKRQIRSWTESFIHPHRIVYTCVSKNHEFRHFEHSSRSWFSLKFNQTLNWTEDTLS